MDNTSKKLFKKSFMGGFKKEDVATYIADISAEHMQEMSRAKEDIGMLEKKNVELLNANRGLAAERKDLNQRIDDLSVKITEGEACKAELFELKQEFADLKAEKESLEAEIANLKNALSASNAKVMEYQSREQDVRRSKEQIANLELEARNRSSQIEKETRDRMAKEIEEHKAYIESETRKLKEMRSKTYADVDGLVAKVSAEYQNTKNAVSDFKVGFKSVVTDLAREIDSISDASLAIEDAINALNIESKSMREGE